MTPKKARLEFKKKEGAKGYVDKVRKKVLQLDRAADKKAENKAKDNAEPVPAGSAWKPIKVTFKKKKNEVEVATYRKAYEDLPLGTKPK